MIDVLADGILGVSADMLSDMEIIAVATPPITLDFVVRISYAVDVLAGELAALLTDAVSVIDVGMLADENANGLAAVLSPSEVNLLAP